MSMQVQLRRFNSMERRPRMLKDFLGESLSSCSSSGFKSLPRKPNSNSIMQIELKSSSNSPFQTLVNTIRSISFFASLRKSPSVLSLPRNLSRKLSSSSSSRKRRNKACKSEINVRSAVKIKDIIRWKSFRDIVEEQQPQQPSLPPPPPPLSPFDFRRCTVESTATTTTVTTSCCSSDSSWSESDFFTSSWEAQNDAVEAVNKFPFSPLLVGSKDSGATEVLTCQEDEQHSPVSVLQVAEDEFSIFDQSIANIKRRKQMFIQSIQKFEGATNLDPCFSLDENFGYNEEYNDHEDYHHHIEVEEQYWIEERAKQLLHCVKAKRSIQSSEDYLDTLLLDFFREELSGSRSQNKKDDQDFELQILRIAEDWINGSFTYDIVQVNNDACIKDMDSRGQWSRLKDEHEELAFEIETAILHNLVADLLD